jgi:hypothetical protein
MTQAEEILYKNGIDPLKLLLHEDALVEDVVNK